MLRTPYAPIKTKTQLQAYVYKFQHLPTKTIHSTKAVSEDKARNNICFKVHGTNKLDRDVFNSQLELMFTSNPQHNTQYIKKIRKSEVEQDIWDSYKDHYRLTKTRPIRVNNDHI